MIKKPGLHWTKIPVVAALSLVAVTAVWGWTFLIVKDAVLKMPVMDFLAVRFTVAAVVMILLRPTVFKTMTPRMLLHGFILGLLLGSAYIAQTFGLQLTSPAVAGFITGMSVVLTPVAGWLILREKVGKVTWFAVVLATVGLAMLSLHGWAFGTGELLVLLCAVALAGHIIGLGRWSGRYDVYGLALIQVATTAVMSVAAAAPGGMMLPPDNSVWMTVIITAVAATALAFIVQTWAQRLVSATHTAVILTMEPVFAGVFAVALGGELLTPRIIVGAVLVLAAMLLVQLKAVKKTVAIHEP